MPAKLGSAGISFVGGSIMKVIMDSMLKSKLVATMKMMNVIEKENFDIFGEGVKRNGPRN